MTTAEFDAILRQHGIEQQKDLAAALRTSPATVSRWRANPERIPPLERACLRDSELLRRLIETAQG